MNLDEWLRRWQALNSEENIGTFQAGYVRLLKETPKGWTEDRRLWREFLRAKRRAEREGLRRGTKVQLCRCGHELEWHHPQSLQCEKCTQCAVFQAPDSATAPEGASLVVRKSSGPMPLPSTNPWEDSLRGRRRPEPSSADFHVRVTKVPGNEVAPDVWAKGGNRNIGKRREELHNAILNSYAENLKESKKKT